MKPRYGGFIGPTLPASALGVWNISDDYIGTNFVASGGTKTTSGVYTIHTFNSSSTFTVIRGKKNVQALIVAGGGGGGGSWVSVGNGAGGGGGGVIDTSAILKQGAYTVTVGAGGLAPAGQANATSTSTGGNSVFNGNTAIGGGYGSTHPGVAGGNGGNGGGTYGNGVAAGTGTSGQGFAGLQGHTSSGAAGGGGGSGSAPLADVTAWAVPVCGGVGYASDISGTRTTYGSGGGGGVQNNYPNGANGGPGGGKGNLGAGTAGTANTGGGGGGTGNQSGGTGSAGGSGVVILRYLTN
jgi:hypothetical protein